MSAFRIGRLAQLSGFEASLLRAWERRYGLLQPVRLSNGFRLYTEDDLALLRRIRTFLDEGFSIGDIARMGRERLIDRATTSPKPSSTETSSAAPRRSSDDDLLADMGSELAWTILDALPSAVIVTDPRGRVRWVNRGTVVLCGYDLAELHGLTPGSVLQGPATDRGAIARLRAGIADQRPCSVSIVNYHKSGEPYLALVEVSPLRIGAKHAGFVGVARKLDERTTRSARAPSKIEARSRRGR